MDFFSKSNGPSPLNFSFSVAPAILIDVAFYILFVPITYSECGAQIKRRMYNYVEAGACTGHKCK